ncbi:unnamed protein product, partial [Meganyctiphanes norvegica]
MGLNFKNPRKSSNFQSLNENENRIVTRSKQSMTGITYQITEKKVFISQKMLSGPPRNRMHSGKCTVRNQDAIYLGAPPRDQMPIKEELYYIIFYQCDKSNMSPIDQVVPGDIVLTNDSQIELLQGTSLFAKKRKLSTCFDADFDRLVKEHFLHVENKLFEMFGDKQKKTINIKDFLAGLVATGLRSDDPRLKETRDNLKRLHGGDTDMLHVDYDTFMGIISDNLEIIVKAFSSSFVIPDFQHFCATIDELYYIAKPNDAGKPATYIPQLARGKANHWAVSVCTVDGQRHVAGDVTQPFTLQSCRKSLMYGVIQPGYRGKQLVRFYVAMTSFSNYFIGFKLNGDLRQGSYCSLEASPSYLVRLASGNLGSSTKYFLFTSRKNPLATMFIPLCSKYSNEFQYGNCNPRISYFYVREKAFHRTGLMRNLFFYYDPLLSTLASSDHSSRIIIASPDTGRLTPRPDNTIGMQPVPARQPQPRDTTIQHEAEQVGLPSKSGVSGCVLLVVPNTMGICLWSPNLDANGNSVRGVQFCMELVKRFPFHQFDNLRGHVTTKQDPRVAKMESRAQILFDLLFSVAAGDLSALRRHALSGSDMDASDYDGRTALHVAASEGHSEIVELLLEHVHVNPQPKDRWARTPLDDATCFGNPRCAEIISQYMQKKGIEPYPIVKAIQSK